MIGNHVAKRAGSFIEAAAMLDANGFGGGNLYVVDVIAIPERLDDVVGKTEDHQVLNGFFAEGMIDANWYQLSTASFRDVAAVLDPTVTTLVLVAMLERLNYYALTNQVRIEPDAIAETLARVAHASLFGG